MQVTFVNVGYGDAILLQMPDGYTALLDGGSALNREFDGDPHRIRCIDYLRAVGIRHLDGVWDFPTSMRIMSVGWNRSFNKSLWAAYMCPTP